MEQKNQEIEIQKTQNPEPGKAAGQETDTPENQTASHAWDILFLIVLIIVVIVCCYMLLF